MSKANTATSANLLFLLLLLTNKFFRIMKNYLNRITINPDICNGKPTVRGMRITVRTILEYLAAGESTENILKAYPVLENEDISAALQYASALLDKNLSSSPQLAL
jgi:uncharacterized protein (DUF433 family)